jgi:hypothetical protein
MPCNCLLLTCLTNGTSFNDSGLSIKVNVSKDEKVLFFVIDDMSNKESTLRDDLNIKDSICDLIIYRKGINKKTFCFVELKGGDIPKAVRQILNTKQKIVQAFNQSTQDKKCGNYYKKLIWKAVITIHSSSPVRTKEYSKQIKQIEDIFGKNNYQITRNTDLSKFLRC